MNVYKLSSKQMRLNSRRLKKAIKNKVIKPVVLENVYPASLDVAPADDATVALTVTFKPE